MKKILFTWELGAGLGHVQPIKQRCELLREHALYTAVQNLSSAETVFGNTPVTLLQAPYIQLPEKQLIEHALGFSDLLYNSGFASLSILNSLVEAWRTLFHLVRPDLVVFDHSPSALLASRGCTFRKVIVGTGFMCPPVGNPFGVFFPGRLTEEACRRLLQTERSIMDVCNRVLENSRQRLMGHISELYADVDKVLLTTLPGLDHFNRTDSAEYLGLHPAPSGLRPEWPDADGKRIYAYLKPFPNLAWLLQQLKQSGHAAIVYANSVDRNLLDQYRGDTMRFTTEPIDLQSVAESCDFAILNSNHDTAGQLLSAGIPLIAIPLTREQQLLTGALVKTGACIEAHPDSLEEMSHALSAINRGNYKQAAEAFSSRYRGVDTADRRFVQAIADFL